MAKGADFRVTEGVSKRLDQYRIFYSDGVGPYRIKFYFGSYLGRPAWVIGEADHASIKNFDTARDAYAVIYDTATYSDMQKFMRQAKIEKVPNVGGKVGEGVSYIFPASSYYVFKAKSKSKGRDKLYLTENDVWIPTHAGDSRLKKFFRPSPTEVQKRSKRMQNNFEFCFEKCD